MKDGTSCGFIVDMNENVESSTDGIRGIDILKRPEHSRYFGCSAGICLDQHVHRNLIPSLK